MFFQLFPLPWHFYCFLPLVDRYFRRSNVDIRVKAVLVSRQWVLSSGVAFSKKVVVINNIVFCIKNSTYIFCRCYISFGSIFFIIILRSGPSFSLVILLEYTQRMAPQRPHTIVVLALLALKVCSLSFYLPASTDCFSCVSIFGLGKCLRIYSNERNFESIYFLTVARARNCVLPMDRGLVSTSTA